MPTERQPKHAPGQPHGQAGYEQRDADVKMLLQFGFWLAILIIAVLIGMKYMFRYVSKVMPEGPPAAGYAPNLRQLPPVPQLQARPRQDLKDYCAGQEDLLRHYAWVDRSAGVVRIPVKRAMDLVLRQGLPARSANAAPAGAPVPAAGELFHPGAQGIGGPCGFLTEQVPKAPEVEAEQEKTEREESREKR